jgi:hypothetical protein
MLVYDRAVRDRVLEGQRRRLADFAPVRIEQRLAQIVAGLSRNADG